MKTKELSKIGTELISASKAIERTPGEILQELFPYIYEASRRMSSRQIAKWLDEKHGIQISQPTISRALRNPAGFEDWFAENIEPTARRVASSLSIEMGELLFDDSERGAYHFAMAQENAQESLSKDELADVEEGMNLLREKWFALSIGTRRACYPAMTREEYEERASHGE
ncbi:MAG: hypothetical protein P4L99_06775 [Chthoniobacter sp.]|nr:hypothetical protein [Chthoniobacter sp.]